MQRPRNPAAGRMRARRGNLLQIFLAGIIRKARSFTRKNVNTCTKCVIIATATVSGKLIYFKSKGAQHGSTSHGKHKSRRIDRIESRTAVLGLLGVVQRLADDLPGYSRGHARKVRTDRGSRQERQRSTSAYPSSRRGNLLCAGRRDDLFGWRPNDQGYARDNGLPATPCSALICNRLGAVAGAYPAHSGRIGRIV